MEELVRAVPIALLTCLLFGAMVASLAAGRLIRGRLSSPSGDDDAKGQEDLILSAVLTLLALFLGFTFSLTLDRFETRREFVAKEATAIGTAYLRAQLLEEPHRTRMTTLLTRYTDNRLALAKADRDRTPDLLRRNDLLVRDIWSAAQASFPSIRQYDFSSIYLDSINEVVEAGSTRKAVRLARVPSAIFLVLFVYVLSTAVLLGYVLQTARGLIVGVFLLALFSVGLMLIVDINRPLEGAVRETQWPMENLRRAMMLWQASP